MREIKFRAWDTANHEIVGWDVLCREGFGRCPQNFFLRSDRILMEYTGLKDKNGEEIYGGDIINAMKREQEKPGGYVITERVYSFPGGFKLFGHPMQDFTTEGDGLNIRNVMWRERGHMNIPDIYYEIFHIEVIGNIYENPELLR